LSCYGDPVIKTPNIDALASQGVLFENGYVTQSVCSPSRSTIFTGLYPHQNGQLGLATHQYGWFKKWPTTYSLLKKTGYRTGLIGKTHVIPSEAVESFVDFRFQKSANFAKRKVAEYAVKAGEFFRDGDEPFFMTVNYPDAHWPLQGKVDGLPETQVDPKRVKVMPYVGGDTPRMLAVAHNYYDCMLRLDACVGQLLRQLDDSGKANNTLVVFIGDHGAQMARGKVTVYEGGMHVPYVVRWPGVAKANRRSKALVSTIDLLPTFMDAADSPTPKGLPGKSIRPVLNGNEDKTFREYLACERNCDAARHTFPQRTIRDARYKLIHSPVRDREDPAARYYRTHGHAHWSGCLTDKELVDASEQTKAGYARWLKPPEYQLYDLKADPHEWIDLSNNPKHADAKHRLQTALKKWQTDTRDPLTDPEKLSMLMNENDAVFKTGRRSPKNGWRYLKYLAHHE
jgi:N-sulfoglucosamine sulfohydrolase